jgi:hypothetical protein
MDFNGGNGMKQFFAKIAEFFQNPDGSYSSRRLFGAALIVCGVVGWFLRLSDTVSTIVIGFGGILLGITTADKPVA